MQHMLRCSVSPEFFSRHRVAVSAVALERQADAELAAATFAGTACLDGALMELDQPLDEREADPEAIARLMAGPAGPRIHIEDLRQHVRGDTDAVVAHHEHRIAVRTRESHID